MKSKLEVAKAKLPEKEAAPGMSRTNETKKCVCDYIKKIRVVGRRAINRV